MGGCSWKTNKPLATCRNTGGNVIAGIGLWCQANAPSGNCRSQSAVSTVQPTTTHVCGSRECDTGRSALTTPPRCWSNRLKQKLSSTALRYARTCVTPSNSRLGQVTAPSEANVWCWCRFMLFSKPRHWLTLTPCDALWCDMPPPPKQRHQMPFQRTW